MRISILIASSIIIVLSSTPVIAHKISIDSSKEIVMGQSAAFSGSFGIYAKTIKRGIKAYFKYINDLGGINGKKLRLLSLDDQGNPEITQQNVTQLQAMGIDMFIGNTGTRSMQAILPLIEAKKLALFFPWGGDKEFNNPKLTHIVNGPGLLEPQIKTIISTLIHKRRITKIALFHADDPFSTDAARQCVALLKKHDITPVKITSYNRYTVILEKEVDKLLEYDPKAIICIAISMPTAKLIKYCFERGHYTIQFFGIDSTLFVPHILRHKGMRFWFTAATEDPVINNAKLTQLYRSVMEKYYPQETYNPLSFTYFLSAAIVTKAIKACIGTLTKEKIITQIEKMITTSIDGIPISFSPQDRHIFGKNIHLIKG